MKVITYMCVSFRKRSSGEIINVYLIFSKCIITRLEDTCIHLLMFSVYWQIKTRQNRN